MAFDRCNSRYVLGAGNVLDRIDNVNNTVLPSKSDDTQAVGAGANAAVGLVYNLALRRYEVMWDSSAECGWGHASTTDLITYQQHGCAGPDRTAGGPPGCVRLYRNAR